MKSYLTPGDERSIDGTGCSRERAAVARHPSHAAGANEGRLSRLAPAAHYPTLEDFLLLADALAAPSIREN